MAINSPPYLIDKTRLVSHIGMLFVITVGHLTDQTEYNMKYFTSNNIWMDTTPSLCNME